jgi:Na+-driven multidrug efflux pump
MAWPTFGLTSWFRCSSLGPAEVATWGLLGTVWDAAELMLGAIAEACEVRCATLLGAGQFEKAKYLSYKSLWIGLLWAGLVSVVLCIFQKEIPRLLTPDDLLQELLAELIPTLCLSHFASGIAVMSDTMLYAQNRFSVATALACSVTILVTLPLSALSSIVFHWNLKGQTGALMLGMSLLGSLCTLVVIRSDWKALSFAVISSHDHS